MRHITATRLARPNGVRSDERARGPSKWALLDRLAEARRSFGLKPPQLAVLRALLSFHPEDRLPSRAPAVVFPSNHALGERLHGMPESTLRRHLARLIAVGVIERRDSPSRKRFALRGPAPLAFGFDLAPLAALAPRIAAEAEAAAERAARVKALRLRIRLALASLPRAGIETEAVAETFRLLRRRVAPADLEAALAAVEAAVEALSPKTAAAAARNGCHQQRPEKDPEEVSCHEREANPRRGATTPDDGAKGDPDDRDPELSLDDVRRACPDLADYGGGAARSWRDLANAGHRAALALGVRAGSWRDASERFGPVWAAGVVGLMLRRAASIGRPDAYFRSLIRRAAEGRLDLPKALARALPS